MLTHCNVSQYNNINLLIANMPIHIYTMEKTVKRPPNFTPLRNRIVGRAWSNILYVQPVLGQSGLGDPIIDSPIYIDPILKGSQYRGE